MDANVKKLLRFVGIGVSLSASAALLYVYLLWRRRDEDDENFWGPEGERPVQTSRQTVLRVPVPREFVGAVIGRQGANVKELQKKTNTRITFEPKAEDPTDTSDRIAIIRGSSENVLEAESLLKQTISEQQDILSEEIYIPARSCGCIIGRNGDNIRHMTSVSQAKITIDRVTNERDPDNPKRITIKGTRDQISLAIALIDEALAQQEANRQRDALSSAGRPGLYRGQPLSIEAPALATEERVSQLQTRMLEMLFQMAKGGDNYLEVYVATVKNPGHFCVQLIGPMCVQLDKMTDDMTDFYAEEGNRALQALSEVAVGDLVAAPFCEDDTWYRATVTKVTVDEYCPDDSEIHVYYVDYGDTSILKRRDLCALKSEYRHLPFQGILCSLAGVCPAHGDWTEEATEAFKVATYASQWQVIMLRPVSQAPTNKRVGNPCEILIKVDLVDTTTPTDKYIADDLVNSSFAIRDPFAV